MRWFLVLCALGTAAMLHAARVEPPAGIRGARGTVEWPAKIEREVPAGSPPAPVPSKAAAIRNSVRLVSAKSIARGLVVDETGAPVPAGEIRGMGWRHRREPTRYGIKGRVRNGVFEFRYAAVAPWNSLPPGIVPATQMTFRVDAPGFAHEEFVVAREAAAALLRGETVKDATIVLQRGAIVEGTVRGPGGRPAARVSVYVIDDPEARGFESRCWTDKQGRFRLVDLDPRRRLWIRAKSNALIASPVPLLPLYATAVTHQSLFGEQVVRPEPNTSVPDGVTTGR